MAEEEVEPKGNEEDQGPAGLRKHARQLEKELAEMRATQERDAAELQTFRRERAFAAAVAEGKVEGVTLADLGDLPAEQITGTLVKAKAAEKEDQRRVADLTQAQAHGFDSLDEYREALEAIKAAKAKETAQRQAGTAAATTGAGREPAQDSPGVIGYRAWEEAVKAGRPADLAQADFVGAKARAFIESQPSAPTGGQT